MNKMTVKDNIIMVILLLPVLAIFMLCPFFYINTEFTYLPVMAMLIGMNVVQVVFGLLLKVFDPGKAVSRFFLIYEILLLSELVLFLVTDGFSVLGLYGYGLRLLIKDLQLVVVVCFCNNFFFFYD